MHEAHDTERGWTDVLRWRAHGATEGAAVLSAAALVIVSGLVHVHLWDIAYRHVATLGPLFLVQAVAALVVAVALATTRLAVVMAGAVLLMLGTIGGFVLADTVGLFGFTLPVVTGWAYLALSAEAMSSVLLVAVAMRHVRNGAQHQTAGAGAPT
jgi:hypothetical protein